MPVLVLNGDLDAITPLGDAAAAAALFPRSTFVTVPNIGHVTALADYADCASGIVRRFLATLQPGDVSCAPRTPEIHVVPEFPRRLAGIPLTGEAGAGDHSNAGDRRGAWAANWSVGDALARWWLMYGSRGHGLRGGSFTASGEYLAYSPIRLRLRGRALRVRSRGERVGGVEPARGHGPRPPAPGGCAKGLRAHRLEHARPARARVDQGHDRRPLRATHHPRSLRGRVMERLTRAVIVCLALVAPASAPDPLAVPSVGALASC